MLRRRIDDALRSRAAKPVLFVVALLPLAALILGASTNQLGANPAEALLRDTGEWALRWLLITLAVTPLRNLLGLPALLRLRRMLGLYTFFYACLHGLAYAWLDMGLIWADIVADIPKRPFILVGVLTMSVMTPLALTSFNGAIRRLGARRWQALHRLVYVAALLTLLHFFWMRAGKNDFSEWSVYALITAALLGWRLWRWWRPPVARSA